MDPRRNIIRPSLNFSRSSSSKSKPAPRKATRENPDLKVTLTVSDPEKLLWKPKNLHKVSWSSLKGNFVRKESFFVMEETISVPNQEEKFTKKVSLKDEVLKEQWIDIEDILKFYTVRKDNEL